MKRISVLNILLQVNRILSDWQLCEFDYFGYSAVKCNDESFSELCRKGSVEANAFAPGKIKAKAKWKAKDGTMKQSVDVRRHSPIFRNIICSKNVESIVKTVFNDEVTYVNHFKISFKFSDQQVWYPHQDVAY